MGLQKHAVILMSHFFTESIDEKYKRLVKELNHERYDIFLIVIHNEKDIVDSIPDYIDCIVYNADDLNSLGYVPIFETLLPGSCHFPILRFYSDHPMYPFYWFIEYDVEFTASWSVLFEEYQSDNADYIVPYLAKFNNLKNRRWQWWNVCNNSGFSLEDSIRAFHPICRYSISALEYINQYQRLGYSAHSEIIIPTCLSHAGFTLKTFHDKFFIHHKEFNSFRYRPLFSHDEFLERKEYAELFHPIKE